MTSGVSGEKKQLNPFLDIPLGGMTRDDSPLLIPLFSIHPLLVVIDVDLMKEMIHTPVYIYLLNGYSQ
jgi:hypothetical protein